MNKKERRAIIKEVVARNIFASEKEFIEGCILDELMYAGLKGLITNNLSAEYIKVIATYEYEDYQPSDRILNYIKYYSNKPEVAAMQHVDLNDCVSYIGEYYDGTPTSRYRKKERFVIEPIKP